MRLRVFATATPLFPLMLLAVGSLSAQVNLTLTPALLGIGGYPKNTIANTSTFAPGFGVSSAQASTVAAPPDNKHEIYIPTSILFPSGAPTIDDIDSVSYFTNKSTTSNDPDWTFYIYTFEQVSGNTGSFYHTRLNSEPYFTATPTADAPANQWHQWATNATHPMRFYDSNRNGNIFGTYTDPTLANLQAGNVVWPATMNSVDYGPEVIEQFSFQTGTAWAAAFRGLLDGVTIRLKDGRFATINFEADLPASSYQLHYFSNLDQGESVINITNDGSSGVIADGSVCVNVYAFSADEQLVSCCSCLVTPNGLKSLKVKEDLVSNTLTPSLPTSTVVKLITTAPSGPANSDCNAAAPGSITSTPLVSGTIAWGSTLHPLPVTVGTPATTFGVTETAFHKARLSEAELVRTGQLCAFVKANGSGYGICKSCRAGGLGASRRQ